MLRGRRAAGGRFRSSLDAITEQAAVATLLNRNLLVVSIQERVGRKGKTSGGKVALADLVVFTRQLATMIDAGLAMVQSLQALAEQTTNKVMRDVIKDVVPLGGGRRQFFRGAGEAPQGVQPALCVHGGCRRAGWLAGGDSGPPGHLP